MIETNSTLGKQVCERILSFLAHLTPVFLNKASKETLISAGLKVSIFSRKRIMPYSSTGKPLFELLLCRTRLHLFLNTALPNLFELQRPPRKDVPPVDGARIRRTELSPLPRREDPFNSERDLMVFTETFLDGEALRPLRRRRARTARPF